MKTVASELVARFNRAYKSGIRLTDMDASAMAGYYLSHYAGDPIMALNIDMAATKIPTTTGVPCRLIIASAMGCKRRSQQ